MAIKLDWRFAPYRLTRAQQRQCLMYGLPGGRFADHPQRVQALQAASAAGQRLGRVWGGALRPGSKWDVAPSADIVTQNYGCTDYSQEWVCPGCGGGHFHSGIDLGYSGGGWSIYRSPIVATRPGTVAAVGIQYLGDSAVAVTYDDGVTVEHGHMDEAWVGVGHRVAPGDVLGLLGTKGNSSGPHVHIEARVDGPRQGAGGCPCCDPSRDPSPYLNGSGAPIPAGHFTGVVADGGAHVREYPGQDAPIVAQPGANPDVVDGGTTLEFDAICRHSSRGAADPVPNDHWNGQLDDRWFRTLSGHWLASAVIKGNPAGDTPAIGDPGPQTPSGQWTAKAAPSGPHLRSYPGVDAPVVRDTAADELLTLDAWCRYGDAIPDAWSGAGDDRWVRLADHSGWLANAVVNGNPPAGVAASNAADFRPVNPSPTPAPPGPVPYRGKADILNGRWVVLWQDALTAGDFAHLKALGMTGVLIRAANGEGGTTDAADRQRWASMAPLARAAGLLAVPWTYWYGPGDSGYTEQDEAAYLRTCAANTVSHPASADEQTKAWVIDFESRKTAGLAAAAIAVRERTGLAMILNPFGDPATAGQELNFAELDAAFDAYAPQMYTGAWQNAMSLVTAAGQWAAAKRPLYPMNDEQNPGRIAQFLGYAANKGWAGVSYWRWPIGGDAVLSAYAAHVIPDPAPAPVPVPGPGPQPPGPGPGPVPAPVPLPPDPGPGPAPAWLLLVEAIVAWLARLFHR
jgi:hypothetical protein